MTIKLYVDWRNREILTKEEYEDEVKVRAEVFISDENDFDIWLEENYSGLEIFNFKEEDKNRVCEEWRKACESYARENAEEEYEEMEIEV